MQNIYIFIAIVSLAIVAILVIFKWKHGEPKRISRLAGLAFAFIMGGLIFGDNLLIGYSFISLGTIFAVVDIIKKLK